MTGPSLSMKLAFATLFGLLFAAAVWCSKIEEEGTPEEPEIVALATNV